MKSSHFSNLHPSYVSNIETLYNVGIFDNSSNLYSAASNFFNAGNYVFTFLSGVTSDDRLQLYVHEYQNMIEFYLRSSIHELRNLTLNNDIQNFVNCDFFEKTMTSFSESTIFSDMQIITMELSNNMKTVTKPKNDLYLLRDVFPQFYDDLTMFEALSYDDDGKLYDDLSTPDVKLYYPEPFVASPSFVHEDVWFLHILQYQH